MNKKELVKKTAAASNSTYRTTETAINALLKVLKSELAAGETITIKEFGKFYTKPYKSRVITAPNGIKINISERIIPSFKAGASLKRACNM